MSQYEEKLSNKQFHNWIKAQLALTIAKDGVEEWVCKKMQEFHRLILESVLTKEQFENKVFCKSCTLENVLPCPTRRICNTYSSGVCNFHLRDKPKQCHKWICTQIWESIKRRAPSHLRHPIWKNTNPKRWCEDPWEIAKCSMPNGYEDANTFQQTDFHGIINVILNIEVIRNIVDVDECESLKKISNEIRHSPDHMIRDSELHQHLIKLRTFLTNTTELKGYPNAINAADKLTQLDADTFEIHSKHVAESVQNVVKKTPLLYEIVKKLEECNKSSTDLEAVLECCFELGAKKRKICDTELESEFKHDLKTFYVKEHRRIRVSPLLPGIEVDIRSFYVPPTLMRVEWAAKLTPLKNPVSSYDDIFGHGENIYNDIYISAHAGLGKTTLAKRMCNLWCTANENMSSTSEISQEEGEKRDIKSMEKFEYLFLVLLRDAHVNKVDDMILKYIVERLSQSTNYRKSFIEHILHNHRCLVILDGLDEWRPLAQGVSVPEANIRTMCSILTTTRPWKMYEIDLSTSKVGNYIEMTFSKEAVESFIVKVLALLSKGKSGENRPSCQDFTEMIKEHHLEEIVYTPIMLIQLVCLWSDRVANTMGDQNGQNVLGRTKCEIFTNIVEFILEIGDRKGKGVQTSKYRENRRYKLPLYFERSVYCKKYAKLLLTLGKLAFVTLFKKGNEMTLAIEIQVVHEDIYTKPLLQQCFRMGLLTESRSGRGYSKRTAIYEFIHKTFQEFFCALHIGNTTELVRDDEFQSVCPSLAEVLDMGNVFTFLSGLNRHESMNISEALRKTLENDEETKKYRSRIVTAVAWNLRFKKFKDLQNMKVECQKECSINGPEEGGHNGQVSLQDLILDDDCKRDVYKSTLKKLVTPEDLKSVKFYDCGHEARLNELIKEFRLLESANLEKIDVTGYLCTDNMEMLLQKSECTLKCLSVCRDRRRENKWEQKPMNFSPACVRSLENTTYLVALMLECLKISHANLQCLLKLLTNRTNMEQINLAFIDCTDDGKDCQGFDLDLSDHKKLNMLQLGNFPISKVKIFPESITLCRIGSFRCKEVLPAILESVKKAEKLRSFMCFDSPEAEETGQILDVMTSLSALQTLVFKKIVNFDNNRDRIKIPPNIQRIKLAEVKMSRDTFELFLSEIRKNEKPVRVELLDCLIESPDVYREIKNSISRDVSCDPWCSEDELKFTVHPST